jgi:hypothetical protein
LEGEDVGVPLEMRKGCVTCEARGYQ